MGSIPRKGGGPGPPPNHDLGTPTTNKIRSLEIIYGTRLTGKYAECLCLCFMLDILRNWENRNQKSDAGFCTEFFIIVFNWLVWRWPCEDLDTILSSQDPDVFFSIRIYIHTYVDYLCVCKKNAFSLVVRPLRKKTFYFKKQKKKTKSTITRTSTSSGSVNGSIKSLM